MWGKWAKASKHVGQKPVAEMYIRHPILLMVRVRVRVLLEIPSRFRSYGEATAQHSFLSRGGTSGWTYPEGLMVARSVHPYVRYFKYLTAILGGLSTESHLQRCYL